MATVTGLTVDRMLAIEAASVVSGEVNVSGDLILTNHSGANFNAGHVAGAPGATGTPGSDSPLAKYWDSAATYLTNDAVGYAGRFWRAITGNVGKCPAFYSDYWVMVTGSSVEEWSQTDPFFTSNQLNRWDLSVKTGVVYPSLTSTAGQFETGKQALKLELTATSSQRIWELDENIVYGGEVITVVVRTKLTAAATGLTLKASLIQSNETGDPKPSAPSVVETQSDQGAVIPTTTWTSFKFTIAAANAKPRTRVNLLFEQAAGTSFVIIDRVQISRTAASTEKLVRVSDQIRLAQSLLSGGGIRKVTDVGIS